jgi:serine/threonine protein kinase
LDRLKNTTADLNGIISDVKIDYDNAIHMHHKDHLEDVGLSQGSFEIETIEFTQTFHKSIFNALHNYMVSQEDVPQDSDKDEIRKEYEEHLSSAGSYQEMFRMGISQSHNPSPDSKSKALAGMATDDNFLMSSVSRYGTNETKYDGDQLKSYGISGHTHGHVHTEPDDEAEVDTELAIIETRGDGINQYVSDEERDVDSFEYEDDEEDEWLEGNDDTGYVVLEVGEMELRHMLIDPRMAILEKRCVEDGWLTEDDEEQESDEEAEMEEKEKGESKSEIESEDNDSGIGHDLNALEELTLSDENVKENLKVAVVDKVRDCSDPATARNNEGNHSGLTVVASMPLVKQDGSSNITVTPSTDALSVDEISSSEEPHFMTQSHSPVHPHLHTYCAQKFNQSSLEVVDGHKMQYFNLPVVYDPYKTGFEDTKDMNTSQGTIIAGRYSVVQHLGAGQAAFSNALQCVDLVKAKKRMSIGVVGERERNSRTSDDSNTADTITDPDIAIGSCTHNSPSSTASISPTVSPSSSLSIDAKDWVCLKVIKNNKDYFDQSLDEIKLLHYINSHGDPDEKHVLRMYDFFYYKEHLCIVSELLRENLYEFGRYIRESEFPEFFTIPRLKRISHQVLTALDYIHSLHLIHCDIKPENIVISSYSQCDVKLIDFGSSCFTTDQPISYIQSRSYRAPEVVMSGTYDERIDVWSFGAVLAELFTGYVLFQNESVTQMLARIAGILGPFPCRLLKDCSKARKYILPECHIFYEEHDNSLSLIYPKQTTLARRLGLHDNPSPTEVSLIDFVKVMLSTDHKARPFCKELLNHPFLDDALDVEVEYNMNT